ncbi:MAG: metal ABC transporter permease, partial [Gemmataceae bacterium]|nr:metal ABC transporter permease [Gemmataceae bacterium]
LPGVTARLWTERLGTMLVLSSLLGAATGVIGAGLSASFDRLPAGPVIVLVGAALLAFSALVAPRRGLLARWRQARTTARAAALEKRLADAHEAGDRSPEAQEAARRKAVWLALLERRPELAHLARPLEGIAPEDALPPALLEELRR